MKILNNFSLIEKYIQESNIKTVIPSNLIENLVLVEFKKSEYICMQGETLSYIFFLAKGSVKVYYILNNGKESILEVTHSNQMLGELELVLDIPAAASVKCLETTHCLALSVSYKDILMNDPDFLRKMCERTASVIKKSNNNNAINLYYSLKSRVVSYILAFENDGRFSCDLKILSEVLGVSYRHLLRVFSYLISINVLKKEDDHYVIIDRSVLANLADDLYMK